jgi:hypothetical protein
VTVRITVIAYREEIPAGSSPSAPAAVEDSLPENGGMAAPEAESGGSFEQLIGAKGGTRTLTVLPTGS